MNKKSKEYWCPRCGHIFKSANVYRKHVASKKCRISDEDQINKLQTIKKL